MMAPVNAKQATAPKNQTTPSAPDRHVIDWAFMTTQCGKQASMSKIPELYVPVRRPSHQQQPSNARTTSRHQHNTGTAHGTKQTAGHSPHATYPSSAPVMNVRHPRSNITLYNGKKRCPDTDRTRSKRCAYSLHPMRAGRLRKPTRTRRNRVATAALQGAAECANERLRAWVHTTRAGSWPPSSSRTRTRSRS